MNCKAVLYALVTVLLKWRRASLAMSHCLLQTGHDPLVCMRLSGDITGSTNVHT